MRRLIVFVAVALTAACAWAGTERELLLMAQGAPVVVAASDGQTCIEIGDEERQGKFCAPEGQPEALWLRATALEDRLVVAGRAPAEVASVVLAGDRGRRELMPEESGLGRFFIGMAVPTGEYEVEAGRADGTTYVSGEMSLIRFGNTLTTITP